ncbi:unnamed protein product [Owenia fusiformis]|uniref:Uncharacterized protein n=1 Tax=Owenia fusiformis TaxID=6347 RepID=A0A8J1XNP1_OWEFU|nr:unnamed protein product [Owenia fusiformis]
MTSLARENTLKVKTINLEKTTRSEDIPDYGRTHRRVTNHTDFKDNSRGTKTQKEPIAIDNKSDDDRDATPRKRGKIHKSIGIPINQEIQYETGYPKPKIHIRGTPLTVNGKTESTSENSISSDPKTEDLGNTNTDNDIHPEQNPKNKIDTGEQMHSSNATFPGSNSDDKMDTFESTNENNDTSKQDVTKRTSDSKETAINTRIQSAEISVKESTRASFRELIRTRTQLLSRERAFVTPLYSDDNLITSDETNNDVDELDSMDFPGLARKVRSLQVTTKTQQLSKQDQAIEREDTLISTATTDERRAQTPDDASVVAAANSNIDISSWNSNGGGYVTERNITDTKVKNTRRKLSKPSTNDVSTQDITKILSCTAIDVPNDPGDIEKRIETIAQLQGHIRNAHGAISPRNAKEMSNETKNPTLAINIYSKIKNKNKNGNLRSEHGNNHNQTRKQRRHGALPKLPLSKGGSSQVESNISKSYRRNIGSNSKEHGNGSLTNMDIILGKTHPMYASQDTFSRYVGDGKNALHAADTVSSNDASNSRDFEVTSSEMTLDVYSEQTGSFY